MKVSSNKHTPKSFIHTDIYIYICVCGWVSVYVYMRLYLLNEKLRDDGLQIFNSLRWEGRRKRVRVVFENTTMHIHTEIQTCIHIQTDRQTDRQRQKDRQTD